MPEVCKLFPFAGLRDGLEDVSRVAEAAQRRWFAGQDVHIMPQYPAKNDAGQAPANYLSRRCPGTPMLFGCLGPFVWTQSNGYCCATGSLLR
jgi:hypothetical protein